MDKFQVSEFNFVLLYIYKWCSFGTFSPWSSAYFGIFSIHGCSDGWGSIGFERILYHSVYSALVSKKLSSKKRTIKIWLEMLSWPHIPNHLVHDWSDAGFSFVSVVSGVTRWLGWFFAGDQIGEVAGEVGEGWVPQSWASSSIAWKWPSWFSN